MKSNFDTSKFVAYLFVLAGALIMLAPFYFMFVFATHSRTEIFSMPPPLWFGSALLENMNILTEKIPFWKNFGLESLRSDCLHGADLAVLLYGGLCLCFDGI